MNISLSKNDELVMKLLHYFITEQGYNPIILHGAKDEIWLENTDADYKIIRIVTNYIHNDEQFTFDIYKTKQIIRTIKRKTFTFNMNALSIFVNLGESVDINKDKPKNIDCIEINSIEDIDKYNFVTEIFPNITEIEEVPEKGLELFIKLTEEINEKNKADAEKVDDVFSKKRPIITYALLLSNLVMFIMMVLAGGSVMDVDPTLAYDFGGLVNYKTMGSPTELYRLVTSMFLHAGLFHLLFNLYALYVLGPQLENFFGKVKYIIIYLGSGIVGGLVSMIFQADSLVSVGASGALFGLIGALIYFGYHYRVYFGQVIKSQILPILIINLGIGFAVSGINIAAHIGGLIGGVLVSMAVGVKYKSTTTDRINGFVMLAIFTGFLIHMAGII